MKKRTKTGKTIALATFYSVFSMVISFSGTYAWFQAKRSVSAYASSFTVTREKGQEAKLYFYRGNYNGKTKVYSGYDKETTWTDFDSMFVPVDEDAYKSIRAEDGELYPSSDTNNPLNTSRIWPGYSLTYALVFTPYKKGNYGLTLTSFDDSSKKESYISLGEGKTARRSLSYAIDRYGSLSDKESGEAYLSLSSYQDRFDSVPENPIDPKKATTIVSPVLLDDLSKEKVLYFTIRFSNDKSTFYSENEKTGYWEKNPDSPSESNCYENLSFSATSFQMTITEENESTSEETEE